jgi:hypothetical protein
VYQLREIFRHVFGHAMTSYLLQEDTWGAQEDVEVHGWSDADSDV